LKNEEKDRFYYIN
jgi:chromosome segregation ATPase